MKNLLLPIFTLLFAITGCNSMTKTERAIFDYLKSICNDASSLELVKYELVNTETVSDYFEEYLNNRENSSEKKAELKKKKDELSNNETIVSYCYKVNFRDKNQFGALVLHKDYYVLFDKDMKPLGHRHNQCASAYYEQMKNVLFEN
jgi:hypothetical protein